jgi:hypothetical protein
MFRPGEPETLVVNQKLDYLTVPWTRAIGERFYVAFSERSEPAPILAEDLAGAGSELIGGGLASEERCSKHSDKRGVLHVGWQQNAPTSLTVREHICAIAQRCSRDEMRVIHVSLG